MSRLTNDRYLYLGLTLFLAASFSGVRRAITDLKSLTQISPVAPPAQTNDAPEDSLPFETLKTLATHPNPNISQIATRILIDRFAALPNAMETLLADKNSEDPKIKCQSITAIEYLGERAQEMASDRLDAVLDALLERIRAEQASSTPPKPTWSSSDGQDTIEVAPAGTQFMWDPATQTSSPVAGFAGWSNVPRERQETAELREDWARRARREAMVVSEEEGDGEWERGAHSPVYYADRGDGRGWVRSGTD